MKKNNYFLTRLMALVCIWAWGHLQSNAQEVLDQEVYDDSSPMVSTIFINPIYQPAQTYIAGMSGGLTKVELFVSCYSCTVAGNPGLDVKIYATDDLGKPTGLALSSTTIPSFTSSGFEWKTATLPSPITQIAGTKYAIVLSTATARTGGNGYQWRYANTTYPSPSYASSNSGISWTASSRVLNFRTYVGPPTLTIGTPTNSTSCSPANGSIAFTSIGIALGSQTLSYKKDAGSASAIVTIAANGTFTLSGLGAGAYTDFAIGATTATGTNPTLTNPTYALTISTPTPPVLAAEARTTW